jgi:hypothetical protein
LARRFDSIYDGLSADQHSARPPFRGRSYRCRCERPVYFNNSLCLACKAPLGYASALGEVFALDPGPDGGTWRVAGQNGAQAYRRCANFDSPAGCNWLVPVEDSLPYCASCRLNRTIPDLADADNRRYWRAIENAKRRLVSELIAFELPVKSKITEDPEHGVAFDLLRSPPNGPRVLTGHSNGLITLNVEEADDAKRERIRHDLHEPYRTLLGHFRHEIGHYYWDRLIAGTQWQEPFRTLFGDERADYAAALKVNYEKGPPPNWPDRHISSYASTHPWEDWAETWAHFMHIRDSLDTAMGYGFDGARVLTEVEPYSAADLYAPQDPGAERFLFLLNAWVGMTTVLNELSRSMGQPDFYPFVMSRPVVCKLHFIHLVSKGTPPTRQ